VIATETILNPFNTLGELIERFGLLSAALTESSPENRRAAYHKAKRLYRIRCLAVHRAQKEAEKDMETVRREALDLFFGCMNAVIRWANEILAEGRVCDREAFEEFYLRSIFSTPS
jgi:hypothetical protein